MTYYLRHPHAGQDQEEWLGMVCAEMLALGECLLQCHEPHQHFIQHVWLSCLLPYTCLWSMVSRKRNLDAEGDTSKACVREANEAAAT